ncbi:hypothetical protein PR202_gb22558 [Eleusine coracana subsp. coracana]|uniref:Glutamate receptor n=1 Tax=Eleusine coracana subsp. coracana TaxID=191504 RepID=A0AAV5FGL3_ELECO|nr:hypothetical protein PR202_gb22558 [Eleusine coracana subsp. coracana]
MKAGAGQPVPLFLQQLIFLVVLLCLAAARGVAGADGGEGEEEASTGVGVRRRVVDVGVILDRTTWLGNISWASMELAMDDFYADARHANYSTRVRLHLRNTGTDAVDAASAGVDLLKNVRVQAIVGPQTSAQAKFLAELGNKSTVPIISFSAHSPTQSPNQTPYFIRTGWNDTSQAEAIASLVQKYNWREVVPVYEDDDSNARFIPDLVDSLRHVDTRVSYKCKIHPEAGEDEIKRAISILKSNWTSAFVVRMSYRLALKFFHVAKNEGMMAEGFVWIMAYGLTDVFDIIGSPAFDVMDGVLGFEPYVPETEDKFRQRWLEKYQSGNPSTSLNGPTVYGLFAYDTAWALALAAEQAAYARGFCGDVFEEVLRTLHYDIPIHYEEFGDGKGQSSGTYDELVYKVYRKSAVLAALFEYTVLEYDAVVGDIMILANRSLYVDFTLPYTESGVRMLVPARDQRQKTAWTFLKPLASDLWLASGAFFVLTGLVVWFIEHRTNQEFRGTPANQIGSIFYFSFSTLVFAHRERIMNNLSRIAVVVWLFVVLILQQSYTASLSSILTVEQLQPTVTTLDEVIRKGANVGYLNDSFLPGLLKRLRIDESKMIAFDSPEEYNDALSTGRVAVIVDEIPYLKVFLKKYCHNYTMVGPTYKFDGFGYAFPRGSPLTPEISRGILEVASTDKLAQLEKQLYGDTECPEKDDSQTSSSLTLHSFLGLFIITGASSFLALILHVAITLYNNWDDLTSDNGQSSWHEWFTLVFKIFHDSDGSNTRDNDEPGMTNVGRTTESPRSISDHIMENFDSDTDTGSLPEGEGTPGRQISVQDPDPLSFAYMHSEGLA